MWLGRVYAVKGQFAMCNQCLNQYELMVGKAGGVRHAAYEDIYAVVAAAKSQDLV